MIVKVACFHKTYNIILRVQNNIRINFTLLLLDGCDTIALVILFLRAFNGTEIRMGTQDMRLSV